MNNRNFWLVGHTFGREGSQLERFIKEGIWETKHVDGNLSDQKLKETVKKIKVGDVLILKSTATKGPNHKIPFLRIKGVGIVIGNLQSYRINDSVFLKYPIKYLHVGEKDFDGSVYGSYRKMLHILDDRMLDVLEYITIFIKDN